MMNRLNLFAAATASVMLLTGGVAVAGDETSPAAVEVVEVPNFGISEGYIPTVKDAFLPGISHANSAVDLSHVQGRNGATVVFVRSAEWCPFCKKQMIELEAIASDLAEAGLPLVVFSYDAPEVLASFKSKHNLSYALVSDTGSENIKAFGLLDETYEEGSRAYGIPHPAIYMISQDGFIQAKLMEEGYKNRPQHEAILEALKLVLERVED